MLPDFDDCCLDRRHHDVMTAGCGQLDHLPPTLGETLSLVMCSEPQCRVKGVVHSKNKI